MSLRLHIFLCGKCLPCSCPTEPSPHGELGGGEVKHWLSGKLCGLHPRAPILEPQKNDVPHFLGKHAKSDLFKKVETGAPNGTSSITRSLVLPDSFLPLETQLVLAVLNLWSRVTVLLDMRKRRLKLPCPQLSERVSRVCSPTTSHLTIS